jgi:hypothetical protein
VQSLKDATISKLARDIENFKRELKERETQIKDLTEKLIAINASKRMDEEKENKEKEIQLLRNVRGSCFDMTSILTL